MECLRPATIATFAVVASACAMDVNSPGPCTSVIDVRDYEVYAAVLSRIVDDARCSGYPPCRGFVLTREVGGWRDSFTWERLYSNADIASPAIDSLLCRNAASGVLGNYLGFPTSFALMSRMDLPSSPYEAMPGVAFVGLSFVGYNGSGSEALVWVTRNWAILGAEGHVFLLDNSSDGWRVREELLLAVA
jgi:hypothetical protein